METWKDIIGYEGLYQISDKGRIRIKKSKKIRKINYCNDYPLILLRRNGEKQKMFKMHRLVALHFVPNPENKSEVNHKKGNKRDCRASQLEWTTPKENIDHAAKHGLRNIEGQNNPMSATSAKRREMILTAKKAGTPTREISQLYGVSRETVCRIYRRYLNTTAA